MRLGRRIFAWLLVCALAIAAPEVLSHLPAPPEGVAARKYDGFAGVIRVWVCEGWQSGYGTLTPWLNNCFSRFEKRNNGVYVQITRVDEGSLRTFREAENPPDMLLFAPGMLKSGEGLADLGDIALEEVFLATGRTGEKQAAAPVAMGGYAFLTNTRLLEELPMVWAEAAQPEKEGAYLLDVPAAEAWRCWPAAAIALLANQYAQPGDAQKPMAGSGLDLGLPNAQSTPEPERTMSPAPDNFLPRFLPEGFGRASSAYSGFTGGKTAAIPATQREIRRLQILSDSGRAPDWNCQTAGAAFTDQLAMLAVVENAQDAHREDVCRRIAAWLLTADSQNALTSVRALPVVRGELLYAQQAGMAQLERFYRSEIVMPNAFNSEWRARAQELFEALLRGEISAQEGWEKLQQAIE